MTALFAYWAMDVAGRYGRHAFRALLYAFVVLECAALGAQALIQAFQAMGMWP